MFRVRKIHLLSAFLAVTGISVIAWMLFTRPGPPTLLAKATKLVRANNFDDMAWRSANKIILVHRKQDSNGTSTASSISSINVEPPTETPLPELTQRWKRIRGYQPKVSPDGNRIMWNGERGEDDYPDCFAEFMNLETDAAWEMPIGTHPGGEGFMRNEILWMPDGRTWVELYENITMVGSTPQRPQHAEARVRKVGSRNILKRLSLPLDTVLVTADGRAFNREFRNRNGNLRFVEYRLAGKSYQATGNSLDEPTIEGVTARDVWTTAFSADGRKVAWFVQFRPVSRSKQLLRLLHFGSGESEEVVSLWTANIDGTNLHEIGRMPFDPTKSPIWDLHWSPDSKGLAFIYSGSLWVVPAIR